MYYYFILQQRILSRKMEELGLHPVMGYFLGILVFLGLSFYLFYKTTYAGYFYAAVGLSLTFGFGNKERNDFLKSTFPLASYRQLRAVENTLLEIPFVFFLYYKAEFLLAGGLLVAALLLSLFNSAGRLNLSIPTPFFRFPFEFTAGFRKYWLLYLVAYFVAWKAIDVDNFNLGVGSLAFVCLLAMSHYAVPENEYYVWIYNCTAQRFLAKKMATAWLYLSLLAFPMVLIMSIFFWDKSWILWLVLGLGLFLMGAIILAKYSAYPREMSLPQVLFFGLGVWFPPLLLIVMPLFYKRAVQRLNVYLQ
ncbi:MAG: hypothetical protein SFV55_04095 [Haliscomenobacter sp.]|uniref:hypothetical protein n=1 Tax=Haliscomenobacter sp. TaxID=2717303 RepID=UPI0029B539EA|nr:hypothetical protein [Haliscomenobacter sp.]MDX2067581.1 hypothetical protein [Haliscomenobacter sp.]